MKNILNISIVFSLLALMVACKPNTPNSTSSFWVRGNCEMCKERIEKSVSSMPGVSSAEWDVETKMMKVTFDSTQTSLKDIHAKVASLGHGTKVVPMDAKANDSLPECCQLDKSMAQLDCCKEGGSCKSSKSCAVNKQTGDAKDCCTKDGACCVDKSCCSTAKGTSEHDCCKAGGTCKSANSCDVNKKAGIDTKNCCTEKDACCVDKSCCGV